MNPKPSIILNIPVLKAGLSCAAGSLQATLAALAPGQPAPGVEVLDALDMNGAALGALPALALRGQTGELRGLARQRQLLAAATTDLCQCSGLSLAELATLRVFVVRPESSARQGAAQVALDESLLTQLWFELLGVATAHGQAQQLQRLSCHAHAFEALSAAAAYLSSAGPSHSAVTPRRALLLACESWLGDAALALLDDIDQLSGPACDGVVPGEAAVLLLLGQGEQATTLRCCHVLEPEDRWQNERPMGRACSEMLLALQDKNATQTSGAAMVLSDAHPNQEAMRREAEYLRLRHWPHLPTGSPAGLDCAPLGYLGQSLFLLQLALLSQQPAPQQTACAYARSLWQHSLMAWRPAAAQPAMATAAQRSLSHA
ncbi:hypothetical protein [Roseateles koreensis]|uniref:Uncharacterized protein n=1 Tax=Roseateles koreensis TaxID=2987526 RepID=A0ABT5KSB3_9BURK|nr:hypothetical protein [Roseateles koreensis]MDC8785305.1 hypothetical protein [Roseateles koreensis]